MPKGTKQSSKLSDPLTAERRQYASPPCFQHEIDPCYMGIDEQGDLHSAPVSWAEIKKWRAHQRSRLVAIHRRLSKLEQKNSAEAVIEYLKESGFLTGHMRIGVYWPLAGEINLSPLVDDLVSHGVSVALPVITQLNQPLEFWAWEPHSALRKTGVWDIPAPARRQLLEVTLLLIPLVCIR